MIRATALDGKSVQSQTGEGVGDVEDLVVKLPEAKLPYVVIVTGGLLSIGSVHHGVPLEALSFCGRDGELVLQVPDRKAIDSRAGIDLEHLPVGPTVGGNVPPSAPAEAPSQSPR